MTPTRSSLVALFLCVAAAPSAQAPALPEKPGIYWEAAGAGYQRVPPVTSMDIETRGIGKSILTQGLAKPKQVVTHQGATSGFVVTDTQPVFFFKMPPPMAMNGDMESMMASMEAQRESGLSPMARSAREFLLIRVAADGDTRVIDSGKLDKIKCTVEEIKKVGFRVRPELPLTPGEYALFHADQGRGGSPATIWGFTIR
jgi:hypothetical protein